MNNNITEAHCSFEVSKLLKEKGFAVMVNDYFSNNGATTEYRSYKANYNSSVEIGQKCSRPTHALAIKWIRENFGIDIETKIWWGGTKQCQYFATIIKREGDSWSDKFRPRNKTFYSPEEATEAAIKYTLKNLI